MSQQCALAERRLIAPLVVESPSVELFQTHLDMVLATSSGWPWLSRVVGLDDLQRCLPTSAILWFCGQILLTLASLPSCNYMHLFHFGLFMSDACLICTFGHKCNLATEQVQVTGSAKWDQAMLLCHHMPAKSGYLLSHQAGVPGTVLLYFCISCSPGSTSSVLQAAPHSPRKICPLG